MPRGPYTTFQREWLRTAQRCHGSQLVSCTLPPIGHLNRHDPPQPTYSAHTHPPIQLSNASISIKRSSHTGKMATQLHKQASLLLSCLLLLASFPLLAISYGSEGPISAAFGGDNGFFCAIEASGKQELVCWNRNGSSPSIEASLTPVPSMATLSGGEGFMCGLDAMTSRPFCWEPSHSNASLVPTKPRQSAYSSIAAGRYHVCAVRGNYFKQVKTTLDDIDCWVIDNGDDITSNPYNPPETNLSVTNKIVAGDGFTCAEIKEGGIICWGPRSLGFSTIDEDISSLSSSRNSLCGIRRGDGEVKCWGEIDLGKNEYQKGIQMISLAAGPRHFCGIRKDDHGIECWGSFNVSSVPGSSGFLSLAASDFSTCGIRENDLVLDCWGEDPLSVNYTPPLQVSSPGLCTSRICSASEFSFNTTELNVPDLSSLCIHQDLQICLPCGSSCSPGYFVSSTCGPHSNRVCTECSLCQNSSCWEVCRMSQSSPMREAERHPPLTYLVIVISVAVFGSFLLFIICWSLVIRRMFSNRSGLRFQCAICVTSVEDTGSEGIIQHPPPLPTGFAKAFRLSELKDATNGFKEFNEVGRGRYGFVYKATLNDGRLVAVKRANAVTRIHTNSRDFEAEVDVLGKLRHPRFVNLLGYCGEMGERLLVYEYMPHGTLHDHLHGGLSVLSWGLRLKIAAQAAKGIEYLHAGVPVIVHGDIKPTNILLDSEWGARIADLGLSNTIDRGGNSVYVDPGYKKTRVLTDKSDVYSFGVVLLEILSARKAFDRDASPPSIVDWAIPLIKSGKATAVLDLNVNLPRNVDPLLKMAKIAELAVEADPNQRPTIANVASGLEQLLKSL